MMAQLYFWGANSHQQSGSGKSDEQFNTPIPIEFNFSENIVQISGGGGHTLTLSKDGKVYSAGWNTKGQLGINSINETSEFNQVNTEEPHRFRKVVCGWDISALISKENDIFMFGNNQYEQFGLKLPTNSDIPVKINLSEVFDNEKVLDISFGLRHTSVLLASGKLLLFGQSRCTRIAQLFESNFCKTHQFQYQAVEFLSFEFCTPVSMITSGQHFTLAYILQGHRMFLLGENKHVNLCNQEIDISHISPLKEVCSGWTHFVLLDQVGNIFTFGRNNYNQLGRKSDNNENKPVALVINEKISDIKCGSEHTMLLTDDGKVLTWGWNEHGNCGVNGVENVEQPTNVQFPKPCLIIGTGYGFSFALIQR
uniref:CSON013515 protein n=1 Tax=Culicoides sonorensis TaxID=179676 RepID=A0A336M063_CULSO